MGLIPLMFLQTLPSLGDVPMYTLLAASAFFSLLLIDFIATTAIERSYVRDAVGAP